MIATQLSDFKFHNNNLHNNTTTIFVCYLLSVIDRFITAKNVCFDETFSSSRSFMNI